MTDNVDCLILEHLKAIRGDLDALKSDMRDVRTRLLLPRDKARVFMSLIPEFPD